MTTEPPPLRIWWNKNLHGKISPGKLAAHAAHAALEAYGITHEHAIVVLAAGKAKIEAMPLNIRDAGHTELAPGTLTTGCEDTTHLNWLAEHDAAIRAEAAAQALEHAADDYTNSVGATKARPHAREWLRARAATYRKGTNG